VSATVQWCLPLFSSARHRSVASATVQCRPPSFSGVRHRSLVSATVQYFRHHFPSQVLKYKFLIYRPSPLSCFIIFPSASVLQLSFFPVRFPTKTTCHICRLCIGTDVSPTTSVFLCQHYSTIALYTFIGLTPNIWSEQVTSLYKSSLSHSCYVPANLIKLQR
jgi:hypothetical protein